MRDFKNLRCSGRITAGQRVTFDTGGRLVGAAAGAGIATAARDARNDLVDVELDAAAVVFASARTVTPLAAGTRVAHPHSPTGFAVLLQDTVNRDVRGQVAWAAAVPTNWRPAAAAATAPSEPGPQKEDEPDEEEDEEDEKEKPAKDADAELASRCEAAMSKNPKLTRGAAAARVLGADPAFAARYRNAKNGRR